MADLFTKQIPWPRILVEGVVIVGSILLAFSIEAWWDGYQNRGQEVEILEGLKRDFEETLVSAREARIVSDEIATAAENVFAKLGPQSTELGADESNRLLQPLFVGGSLFRPQQATLGALLSSQGLDLLSNTELRGRLANWSTYITEIERWQNRSVDLYFYAFTPYLRERIPTKGLDSIAGLVGASQFELDARVLFNDHEFEGLINDIYYYSKQRIIAVNAAEKEVLEILQLVEKELN